MQETIIKIKEIVTISKDLNVLYVEDNDEARMQTLKMLQNFFTNIDTGLDGVDGLQQYQRYHDTHDAFYDLVITDVNMPNMDGITMSENITKIHAQQQIVIISAFNDKQNYANSREVGVQHYIHKPIELTALIDAIDKVTQAFKVEA